MSESLPEPWLRGPLPGVHPVVAPAIRSFQQAREDLARHMDGLTPDKVWARPHGLAPLGFQLRHIAGSVDRLMTYLMGGQLSESQMAVMSKEMEPGASLTDLLAAFDASLAKAEAQLLTIDPATLIDPRFVGRKQLPTTVQGLLVHIAEHTQRHVGQAISAAKLVRASSP